MRTLLKDKISKETFWELYVNKNLTIKDIANLFNTNIVTVTRLKKKYNIETKLAIFYKDTRAQMVSPAMTKSIRRRRKQGRISDKLPEAILKYLYYDCNLSLADIGQKFGCSRMYIMKLCRLYNIPRRSKSNARLEAEKKGKIAGQTFHNINKNFFKEWSPASAWVLGLLFTDGHISIHGSGNYVVSLSSIDYSLLLNVKNLMKSTHPIRRASKKQPNLYTLQFARDEMVADLMRLGMVPRKSLVIKFPEMPKEFHRHFIRGCWDGDGSVFFDKKNPKFLRAHYISGSKDFIYELEKILQTEVGLPSKMIYHRDKYYYFRYARENSIKLFHYLYDDVSPDMYLDRKYNKFIQGINASSFKQPSLFLSP